MTSDSRMGWWWHAQVWLLILACFLFGCAIGMGAARRAINDPGAISPWLQQPVPVVPMPEQTPNLPCRGWIDRALNPGCFQRDTELSLNEQAPLQGGKVISDTWN